MSDQQQAEGAPPPPPPPLPPSAPRSGEAGEHEYVVEAIRGKLSDVSGAAMYLVKWEGFSDAHNTWEPEEHLDCAELVAAYEANRNRKRARERSPSPSPPSPPVKRSRSGRVVRARVRLSPESTSGPAFYDRAPRRARSCLHLYSAKHCQLDNDNDNDEGEGEGEGEGEDKDFHGSEGGGESSDSDFDPRTPQLPSFAPRRKVANRRSALALANSATIASAPAMKQARACFVASVQGAFAPFADPRALRELVGSAGEDADVVNRQLFVQPDVISGGEMRDYQLLGLSWLVSMHDNGMPAILGDEMGLGKTLQTIALIAQLKFVDKAKGPALVVCPLSVLAGWMAELQRWCPDLSTIKLHNPHKEERASSYAHILDNLPDIDVVVTTYDTLKCKDMSPVLSVVQWRLLVLDEGHIIKNAKTEVSHAVRRVHCQMRIVLTGTPLQNNLTELWAILNFLLPALFPDDAPFSEAFDLANGVVDLEKLSQAHELLRKLMLRRLKGEVERAILPKVEISVSCPLSAMQLFWYKKLLQREREVVLGSDNSSKKNVRVRLTNLLMQLRKCCNHPFMFPNAEVDPETTSLRDLVCNSGKLALLDRMLLKLKEKGHRVVIFSQFTVMLDILDDYCTWRGFKFCRIDGSSSRVQRDISVSAFNAPNSPDFIFLMSTRAGGLGVNLQTADTVVLFDSDWNPQADLQAQARVHRIGQLKVVHVYRLVSWGTVEQRMLERCQKKLYLDLMVNRGSTAQAELGDKLGTKELLSMLRFGSEAMFRPAHRPSDKDLDALLARDGKSKCEHLQPQQCSVESFNPHQDMLPLQTLLGQTFVPAPKSLTDIAREWKAKRERKATVQFVHTEGGAVVPVLTKNMYGLEGEPSVFQREQPNELYKLLARAVRLEPLANLAFNFGMEVEAVRAFIQQSDLRGSVARKGDSYFYVPQRRLPKAGEDYPHQTLCIGCFKPCCNGSPKVAFYKCPHCPVVAHVACVPPIRLPVGERCSHHVCCLCRRPASKAGGVLFRCAGCPNAFCEEDVPKSVLVIGRCARFEAAGFENPDTACFVFCSKRCRARVEEHFPSKPQHNDDEFDPTPIDDAAYDEDARKRFLDEPHDGPAVKGEAKGEGDAEGEGEGEGEERKLEAEGKESLHSPSVCVKGEPNGEAVPS